MHLKGRELRNDDFMEVKYIFSGFRDLNFPPLETLLVAVFIFLKPCVMDIDIDICHLLQQLTS